MGFPFPVSLPIIGPELIWVGNQYGQSETLPRIAFVGYNPRYEWYQMGFRESLCRLRNLDPWNLGIEFDPMIKDEWDKFQSGADLKLPLGNKKNCTLHWVGYAEFDHTLHNYCYAMVINTFFNTNLQNTEILDWIGIFNGYIYPGRIPGKIHRLQ